MNSTFQGGVEGGRAAVIAGLDERLVRLVQAVAEDAGLGRGPSDGAAIAMASIRAAFADLVAELERKDAALLWIEGFAATNTRRREASVVVRGVRDRARAALADRQVRP